MTEWRLLLTRPVEECEVLSATLAEQGIFSSSLPLLAIEPLVESPGQRAIILELDRYCAVIVVSKPAARLGLDLLDRYWPQPPTQQAWFSVGAATGKLLADYGLTVHWPDTGDDSEALLTLPKFTEALAEPGARVLIMRGEGGREFLAERLRGQGIAVDYLELYRRQMPDYPRCPGAANRGGTPERPGGQQWPRAGKPAAARRRGLAGSVPPGAVRAQPKGG